jgi:hypothetical protein
MSAIPPGPPVDTGTLPWESRAGRDPVHAFIESLKLFATNPDRAWGITPERGGFESPLLFGLIVSFIGSAVAFVYRWIFVSPFVRMFPGAIYRRWGWAMGRRPHGCGILFWPIGAAFGIVVGLFVGAAILHLFVLIVGAARTSASGFEGTFRVAAYASTASLAQVIPFVGGLVALVWGMVLAVKGIQRMHRTTTGRAAAAVLLPVVLVAVCIFLAMIAILGLVFAAGHHSTNL